MACVAVVRPAQTVVWGKVEDSSEWVRAQPGGVYGIATTQLDDTRVNKHCLGTTPVIVARKFGAQGLGEVT